MLFEFALFFSVDDMDDNDGPFTDEEEEGEVDREPDGDRPLRPLVVVTPLGELTFSNGGRWS